MTTSTAQDADLSGLSVLIVEDEYYLAMEMQDQIERVGGRVVGPVGGLAEGVQAIERGGIDCALIDINLGEGPSFEIAEALCRASIPFLFLTGYDAATIPGRFDNIECIQKPANFSALLRALTRFRALIPAR